MRGNECSSDDADGIRAGWARANPTIPRACHYEPVGTWYSDATGGTRLTLYLDVLTRPFPASVDEPLAPSTGCMWRAESETRREKTDSPR